MLCMGNLTGLNTARQHTAVTVPSCNRNRQRLHSKLCRPAHQEAASERYYCASLLVPFSPLKALYKSICALYDALLYDSSSQPVFHEPTWTKMPRCPSGMQIWFARPAKSDDCKPRNMMIDYSRSPTAIFASQLLTGIRRCEAYSLALALDDSYLTSPSHPILLNVPAPSYCVLSATSLGRACGQNRECGRVRFGMIVAIRNCRPPSSNRPRVIFAELPTVPSAGPHSDRALAFIRIYRSVCPPLT
jgi:hypothetical protein